MNTVSTIEVACYINVATVQGPPVKFNYANTVASSLILVLCSSTAHGQTNLEQFERQAERIRRETFKQVDSTIPTAQRALFEYGSYIIANFFAIDDDGQNTHILREFHANVFARLSIDQAHEFFVRARTTHRDFNHGDSFDGTGDDWIESTLDRGHYRFDLARHVASQKGESIAANLQIQSGRQLVHWVNGLTLSQEIDGGIFTFGYDSLNLDAVVGQTRHSSFDFDSSRPGFDGDTKRNFYGGMLSYQITPEHRPFIYGLVQDDGNDQDFDPDPLLTARITDPTLPILPTRFHYDSHYIGAGSTGNLGDQILYAIEIVYEGGSGLSNSFDSTVASIPQTEEDIQAFAIDLKLDYLFHDDNRTRAVAEIVLATGDDDRGHTSNTFSGNTSGSTDNAFNAFGLINTGMAFAPNASNLIMLRTGIATFPFPNSGILGRLQMGVNAFVFSKFDTDAPIDEPTSNDTYLGFEPDIWASLQLTSDVAVSVRYGVFFPGTAILTDTDPRHFFFSGLTYSF